MKKFLAGPMELPIWAETLEKAQEKADREYEGMGWKVRPTPDLAVRRSRPNTVVISHPDEDPYK